MKIQILERKFFCQPKLRNWAHVDVNTALEKKQESFCNKNDKHHNKVEYEWNKTPTYVHSGKINFLFEQ